MLIDILERRVLLAAVTITGAKLRIEGTAGDDSIAVARFSKSQGQVIDGGNVVLTFNLADVKVISFAGQAGNDTITIGNVPIRALLNGGDGNDQLSASRLAASDTLEGGAGNDYLFGGDGNDYLTGGTGYDTMLAGGGDDRVFIQSDSSGDDVASGGDGADIVSAVNYTQGVVLRVGDLDPNQTVTNDTVYGDFEWVIGSSFADDITVVSGRSTLVKGEAGNDTITTGRGDDTLYGGPGNDLLSSAGGRDYLFGDEGGIDTLNGGTGFDTAIPNEADVLLGIEDEI